MPVFRRRANAPTPEALRIADLEGQIAAIARSQCIVEFTLDGEILAANDNFLSAVGYRIDEVAGRHHAIFVSASYRESREYRAFWERLRRGEFTSGQFCRYGKGGREVWLQATYNPIFDGDGRPFKVVKYATDITAEKIRNADYDGQISAIRKALAVIEFRLDGTIISANENFLRSMGYRVDEVIDRHHRVFVTPEHALSEEYAQFWRRLGSGEHVSGQFLRYAKNGDPVYLQASYSPIFDANGRAFKIVKYATDVTEQVLAANALRAAVEETQRVVDGARSGNLSRRIRLDDKHGMIGDLCSGVNDVLQTLADVVHQVKVTAHSVEASAVEISSGNGNLSMRTERQAVSLEETAAAMKEMTVTVRQNADHATRASDLASSASGVAKAGTEIVGKVVSTIAEIAEASKRIADIIDVIDGIAYQTNILALNAAVEAARAGDHGRGFAVVASEVRNLAQRSATAAKETKTLIGKSAASVANGMELAGNAGQAIHEIASGFTRVAEFIEEIAAGSQEQSAGLEQIAQALLEIDEVTQLNASLVQEVSAAATGMRSQTAELVEKLERLSISA